MTSDRHLGDVVHELLDGRIHWAARAEAEAHVAGCARCSRERAALQRVRDAVRQAPAPAPPADLAARLSAALDEETGVRAGAARPLGPTIVMAALVLAAVLAAAVLALR